MRLNVDIKDEIYNEFVEFTKDDGRSISDVVRDVMLAWIKKRRRERFQSHVLKEDNDGKRVG